LCIFSRNESRTLVLLPVFPAQLGL
jgi:hypothetical protein